jgi:hypothetical protein
MAKGKPDVSQFLPPSAVEFAQAADKPIVPPRSMTEMFSAETEPAAIKNEKPISHAAPLQEGKVAAPLRLAPSVQQRIRRLVFEQSEQLGVRVTAQDFMESAIMERLNREEKKMDRA